MSEEPPVDDLVWCPRCDRAYPTVEAAKRHVDLAHPDQINPFRED